MKIVVTVAFLLFTSHAAHTVNDRDGCTVSNNGSLHLLLDRLNESCLPEELRLHTANDSLKAVSLLNYFRTRNNVIQPGMRLEEEEGWVSFDYNIKEPRPAFKYVMNKSSNQPNSRFITLVVPYENAPPAINLKSTSDFQLSLNEMELELEENGEVKKIGFKIN